MLPSVVLALILAMGIPTDSSYQCNIIKVDNPLTILCYQRDTGGWVVGKIIDGVVMIKRGNRT